MKNSTKKLQKRTVFIFKNLNIPDASAVSDATTSTDPTTVLTPTVTTAVQLTLQKL